MESRQGSGPRLAPFAFPRATAEVAGLVLLLAIAALLRAALLEARSLWFDEAYSVWVASLPWPEALRAIRVLDPHPPLYYLLLSGWMKLGTAPAAVRSLSAVLGVLTVIATWVLARRVGGRAVAWVSGAFVATSAFAIQASVEARMYPLLALATVLATLALWEATNGSRRLWWWAAYAGALSLALYTDYFALLVVPAHAAFVSIYHRHDREVRLGLLMAMGAVVLAFGPWVPVAVEQLARGQFDTTWKGPMPWTAPLNIVALTAFGGYLLDLGGYLLETAHWSWRQVALVLPFAGLACLGGWRAARREAGVLVSLVWVVPVLLLIGVSLVRGIHYAIPRYTSFVQPFFAILLAQAVLSLGTHGRWRMALATAAAAAVVAVNLSVLAQSVTDSRFQVYNWAGAARHVQERWQEGDAVVFYPTPARIAFGYYFKPPIERTLTLSSPPWNVRHTRDEWARLLPAFPENIEAARRLWLVVTIPWPESTLQALVGELEKRYTRRERVDFLLVWVLLYERR